MQDAAEPSEAPPIGQPAYAPPLPRRRGARTLLAVALIAFLLGSGTAGWLVWRGELDALLPSGDVGATTAAAMSRIDGEAPPAPVAAAIQPAIGLGGVETRLALLEERLSRIDQQAGLAAANAGRAEALLIAVAARRALDRGEPLGYLEDQLKLRFGDGQPQAVQTIVDAARNPVTLYLLSSQLEAAAPALSGERRGENNWNKIRREVASLFVVRRTSSAAMRSIDRTERAQVLLKAGRIEDAIAEVERLPGAEDAQEWIAAARRYDAAQRALGLIETAAVLEPRQPRDDQVGETDDSGPLAPPAEAAAPAAG